MRAPTRLTSSALALVVSVGLLGAPALGGDATDTFTGGLSEGGWSFGVFTGDTYPTDSGSDGQYLRNTLIDSFAPRCASATGTINAFHGDYVARNVVSLSFSAITHSVDFGAGGRNMSLLLRDTKGTPSPDDDDYVFFPGDEVPQPGQGFVDYQFDIPSGFVGSPGQTPAGWYGGYSGDAEHLRPGVSFQDVLSNVDRVEIWWLDPRFFAIFQQWDVGIDTITIATPDVPAEGSCVLCGPGLYPDCTTLTEQACGERNGTYLGDGVGCPPAGIPRCPCDWNCDLFVNDQDFFDFVNDFFGSGSSWTSDYNADGFENDQDFFDFANCFFEPMGIAC